MERRIGRFMGPDTEKDQFEIELSALVGGLSAEIRSEFDKLKLNMDKAELMLETVQKMKTQTNAAKNPDDAVLLGKIEMLLDLYLNEKVIQ